MTMGQMRASACLRTPIQKESRFALQELKRMLHSKKLEKIITFWVRKRIQTRVVGRQRLVCFGERQASVKEKRSARRMCTEQARRCVLNKTGDHAHLCTFTNMLTQTALLTFRICTLVGASMGTFTNCFFFFKSNWSNEYFK